MRSSTATGSAPYPTRSPRNAWRSAPSRAACSRHALSPSRLLWMSAKSASFTACAATPRSHRLLQLLEDGGVLEGRHILRDFFPLRDRAQQPAHDLAGAGLRQVVAEADVLRLGDRADFLRHPVAQLVGALLCLGAGRARAFEHHERAHRLAGKVVGTAHYRRLGDERLVRDPL